MRVDVDPKLSRRYTVTVADRFENVQVTVRGRWPWSKSLTDRMTFLVDRNVSIQADDIDCRIGRWGLNTWHERAGRGGLGLHIGMPQVVNIQLANLRVDDQLNFHWNFELSERGRSSGITDLLCEARLNTLTRPNQTTDVHPTWGPRHNWNMSHRAQAESAFALCGFALDPVRGQLRASSFRVDLITGTPSRTLSMSNSEGTLQWTYIGR